jgi:succinoglycan biosynthesis transport protein ExoP
MNNLPSPSPENVAGTNFALSSPNSAGQTKSHPASATPNPSASSVWDYLRLARKRKLALAASALLGLFGGFATVIAERPVFQAVTTVEVQGFNESFMNMSSVDPLAGTGNYSSTQANINTQLRIIESGSVRAPVTERLQRETTPMTPPTTNVIDKLRQKIRKTPLDPLQEMKGGLGMAASSLKAKSILGTRIIAISCDSTIPDIAANFANTIAAEYIAQSTQLRSTNTQRTSQWLESQLEETKVKLEQAEGRLQEFVRKSGVAFVGDQETLADSKLKQLQTNLAGIQGDRVAKQTKYEMLKSSPADSIPEIIDDANLREYQSKIADLNRELAQRMATLTPQHPKVREVQAQIAQIQEAFQRERASVLQRIENEYRAAQRQESLLVSAYNAQAGAVSAQADKASQYSTLKREVDIYRQTLNTMLQQVNQASAVSAVPTNNIRVVDPASPPGQPYKPDPVYTMGIGTGLGLVAGFGLVLLRDGASKRKATMTFGNPGYASSVLFIPELGVIPSASFGYELPPGSSRKRGRDPGALLSDSSAQGDSGNLALAAWQNQPSLLAESFRLTLTSLTLMNRNGSRPRLLVVTSPGPGEGKTTVTSNIAAAMAETGRKILVIDMDLRRPNLHRVFNVANEHGLTDLIRGTEPEEVESFEPFVRATGIPRVFILPSGPAELAEISELLHSPRVPVLLKQLRRTFDTIIVDTPPMLQFSEARIVSSFADGVILVIRSGRTDRESAVIAREQLTRDGIAVLGTILNDWDPRTAENAHASYYKAYMHYQKDRA